MSIRSVSTVSDGPGIGSGQQPRSATPGSRVGCLSTPPASLRDLVWEHMWDGVIVTDPSGRIVDWNPAAERIFGYTAGEVLGRRVSLVESPLADPPLDARIAAGVERQGYHTEGLDFLRRSGAPATCALNFVPILDPDGSVVAVVGVCRDITDRRRAEEQVQRAREAAEAADRAKGEFLANVSHEIRTPMNGIIGMTDLALDTDLTGEQREYLELVRSSATSLLHVINDILDFSKIEAGRLDLNPVPFRLSECVEGTMKALAFRAAQKNLELACRIPPHVPDHLIGDPDRLRQILVNLVGNAVKFTHSGEVVVTVELHHAAGANVMLHFSVRDTGIGIPAHLQEMIFEPFSQADASTTRKYGGTGLGLAIAGRLIALMEGRIWLDSAEGEGSTFHFTASFEAAPERNTAHEVPADLTGQAILVVDDNRTNRRILEETLTLWGVEADTAASGREALERVSARRRVGRPFGAVLLDLAMPEMDGRAVAAEIQRSDPSPPLLVLLSSADGAALRETSPEAEFGAILTKPINRGLLLNTLRQLLGRKEPSVSESGDDSQQIPPLRSALRVLVAEDNPVNQRVAVRMLEKRGYQVHLAANGREALAALDRHAFDVVLMDVQMPELNGFQATAAIREREQDCQRRLPVIAMTAHAMKGDQERCLAAGMDGYLSKPIRAADLYETIERLYHTMNQPSKSDASACAVAACLDLDALKAQYGDDPDLLEEVLDIFEADSLKLMERIRTALTDDALEAVSRAAHTLKGAISNIFAPPAHAAAFAVEQTSRSGDPGATAAAFGELQRAMEHLPAALAALRVDVATWEPSI